jgi:hypothetical protein
LSVLSLLFPNFSPVSVIFCLSSISHWSLSV